jgi:hypothetical protein
VRVLLDECVDRRFAGDIAGHEVSTVPDVGWASLKNGELLGRAQAEFDVFVTVDRNLPFQSELSAFAIAVVVIRSPSNRVTDLRRLIPELLAVLPEAKAGQVTWVGT